MKFAYVRLVQDWNAEVSMPVTPAGIVTLVKPEQYVNALSLMMVTLLGIETLARLVQFWNALLSMLVTPTGINGGQAGAVTECGGPDAGDAVGDHASQSGKKQTR